MSEGRYTLRDKDIISAAKRSARVHDPDFNFSHRFFIRKDITMKKIISAALALTLLAGTGSAFAQGNDDHRDAAA